MEVLVPTILHLLILLVTVHASELRDIAEPYISPAVALSPNNALPPLNPSPEEAPSPHNDMGHSHDAEQPILPPQEAHDVEQPNEDCSATLCTDPYTNTPPGSPCGCVWPIQVRLRFSVPLYTFFPLVSELAAEIAAGVYVKRSQVRVIEANAAYQQPDKTVALIDLVPLGEKFDNTTAFLTYQRFWHKKVSIKAYYFGNYEVLYVRYPGLPRSPPPGVSGLDNEPHLTNTNNARTVKPVGVDVHNRQPKDRISDGMIAIITLSTTVAVGSCLVTAWILIFTHNDAKPNPHVSLSALNKPSGGGGLVMATMPSSASLSFGYSIASYSGSAKIFSASDIERTTNNFDPSRILGEGGFGRVYSGTLEDGIEVAIKVLKRDDHQGGREFLAEVEMLSRLHHRNLVKLIGICTEEHNCSLVYELVPNGSVESHLHGIDKETGLLDWGARMKIALGAARGLSYLHEDSSPRVIHRDFKSSNILLEHDFTPKVSDFGLARTATDEESRHITTHVMGTFGYVAPEYAMTGHLLVKSDVYSYGVVLLELLTGRKPIDMSQPPGEENLVAWARPLLTSKEGLDVIIDKSLDSNVPFENIAKVAAIASMCVQPEVSHRPFMSEVVQALKLVCNQCDEVQETSSQTNSSSKNSFVDMNDEASSSKLMLDSFHSEYLVPNSISGLDGIDTRLSISDLLNTSINMGMQESRSLRRCFSSAPLRIEKSKRNFWQRMRSSMSEHGMPRLSHTP
ncbi:Receptor-like serine/threonine-protein kinase ALE2 [Cucurbita argyrosperma subsp. argyrosperma]